MRNVYITLILFLISSSYCLSQQTIAQLPIPVQQSQWHKAKVAYLGDSITDKRKIGTKKLYWEHLQDMFDMESFVYGQSGHTWKDLMKQAEELKNANITDLSAIFIFAGTNDYNANLEMGTLYNESLKVTNHNGEHVERKYRESNYDDKTFYGRINNVLLYLKENFPTQQIIIMTPLHRGFAQFSEKNVQPDERYANGQGLYIDDYVEAIKKAGAYWSVPFIDLFGTAGLSPLVPAHDIYFANKEKDLLHPNTAGHERMAQTIAYQLLNYPSQFK